MADSLSNIEFQALHICKTKGIEKGVWAEEGVRAGITLDDLTITLLEITQNNDLLTATTITTLIEKGLLKYDKPCEILYITPLGEKRFEEDSIAFNPNRWANRVTISERPIEERIAGWLAYNVPELEKLSVGQLCKIAEGISNLDRDATAAEQVSRIAKYLSADVPELKDSSTRQMEIAVVLFNNLRLGAVRDLP